MLTLSETLDEIDNYNVLDKPLSTTQNFGWEFDTHFLKFPPYTKSQGTK